MDEETDAGNHGHHHQGQGIHRQTNRWLEGANLDPGPERETNGTIAARIKRNGPGRRQGSEADTGNADDRAGLGPQATAGKGQHQGAHQRHDKRQSNRQLHHPRILLTRSRLRDLAR